MFCFVRSISANRPSFRPPCQFDNRDYACSEQHRAYSDMLAHDSEERACSKNNDAPLFLTSPGPVFYSTGVTGNNGDPYKNIKFIPSRLFDFPSRPNEKLIPLFDAAPLFDEINISPKLLHHKVIIE